MENSLAIFQKKKKLNRFLPYGPAILLLRLYPRELKTQAGKYSSMSIESSIIHSNFKGEAIQMPTNQ